MNLPGYLPVRYEPDSALRLSPLIAGPVLSRWQYDVLHACGQWTPLLANCCVWCGTPLCTQPATVVAGHD